MTSDIDYDQHVANQHEQAMRETRVKIAKIEAKRDIKVARSGRTYQEWLQYRIVAVCIALVIISIVAGVTYASTRPTDPTKERIRQEQFNLCMDVEKDIDKCENL